MKKTPAKLKDSSQIENKRVLNKAITDCQPEVGRLLQPLVKVNKYLIVQWILESRNRHQFWQESEAQVCLSLNLQEGPAQKPYVDISGDSVQS